MALKKSMNLQCGVSGEYHKILQMTYDGLIKKANITVGIYKDKASRDAGKSPIDRKLYASLNSENGSLEDLYIELKAKAEYSGAQDE